MLTFQLEYTIENYVVHCIFLYDNNLNVNVISPTLEYFSEKANKLMESTPVFRKFFFFLTHEKSATLE